ncbi:Ras-like protein family member 10B, partial [Araneus ventricosus]
IAVDFFH